MDSGTDSSSTDISLLLRIRRNDRDEAAWRRFVDRYGYRIYQWCLHRQLQNSDAEDVTQIVLLKLARRLGSFEYDSSQTFKGWLRRITENTLTDFFRERHDLVGGDQVLERLSSVEARRELSDQLADAFDLELLDEAVRRVRQRVSPQRFEAWERLTHGGQKAIDVAAVCGMKIASVYTTRSQVQKLINAEVQAMEAREMSRLSADGHSR
nr:RNA polymerase sigma factor [Rhodopirellula sp. SM50]